MDTVTFMKISTRLAIILSLLVFIPSLQAASPLEKKMKIMKQATKDLKAGLEAPAEPDQTALLKHVTKLREAATAAASLEPAKTADVPEAKRDAFVASYKKAMENVVKQIDELAQFVSAGNWDAARKQMGVINQSRRDGHKEFMNERE